MFILHRHNGLPWHLHVGSTLHVKPMARGVAVVSEPVRSGFSGDRLIEALLSLT